MKIEGKVMDENFQTIVNSKSTMELCGY